MDLTSLFLTGKDNQQKYFQLGGTLGLYDVSRNKITMAPIMIIFHAVTADSELKKLIHHNIVNDLNHVSDIKKLLQKHGYGYPEEPDWDKIFKDSSSAIIPSTILNDKRIAMTIREFMRASITVTSEALRNATNPTARDLIYKIFKEESKRYDDIISIQQKNHWTDFPPTVLPQ